MLHEDEQEECPARESKCEQECRFVAGTPLMRRHVGRVAQRHGRHGYRRRHKPHAPPPRHHERVDQRTLQELIPVLEIRHKKNTPGVLPGLCRKARRNLDQHLVGQERFRSAQRKKVVHRIYIGYQVRQIGWVDGREHVDRSDNLGSSELAVHLDDNWLIRWGLGAGIEAAGREHGNGAVACRTVNPPNAPVDSPPKGHLGHTFSNELTDMTDFRVLRRQRELCVETVGGRQPGPELFQFKIQDQFLLACLPYSDEVVEQDGGRGA